MHNLELSEGNVARPVSDRLKAGASCPISEKLKLPVEK